MDVEKLERLCIAGGDIKWCTRCRETAILFSTEKEIQLHRRCCPEWWVWSGGPLRGNAVRLAQREH